MAMKGELRWISIGFEPLEWMKDADMIMGTVEGERATVLDLYSTGRYGPHEDDASWAGPTISWSSLVPRGTTPP